MKSSIVEKVNILTLIVGSIGLMGILGEGVFRLLGKSNYPLDTNWIATFLIIFYTGITGVKFVVSGRKKNGYYLLFFSLLLVIVAATLFNYRQ